jgi:hypothetical protein
MSLAWKPRPRFRGARFFILADDASMPLPVIFEIFCGLVFVG